MSTTHYDDIVIGAGQSGGPLSSALARAGRRTGGDTVSIPIPPVDVDRLQLTVHHHLRPLPVVAEVRLGRTPSVAATITAPAPGPR